MEYQRDKYTQNKLKVANDWHWNFYLLEDPK